MSKSDHGLTISRIMSTDRYHTDRYALLHNL